MTGYTHKWRTDTSDTRVNTQIRKTDTTDGRLYSQITKWYIRWQAIRTNGAQTHQTQGYTHKMGWTDTTDSRLYSQI